VNTGLTSYWIWQLVTGSLWGDSGSNKNLLA